MNEEILKKAADVERQTEIECAKARRSFIASSVIYGVLFLFVVGYTTIVFSMIKDGASPERISAIVIEKAREKIPVAKDELVRMSKENSDALAIQVMDRIHGMLPHSSEYLKTQIDVLTDEFIAHTQNEYVPQIKTELKKALSDFKSESKDFTDPEVVKGFAELMADTLDEEMGKIIDEDAKGHMNWILNEIATLSSKPAERMNARELSEKRFLICWLFLLNHGEIGDSKLNGFIRTASALVEHVDKAFIEEN